MADSAKLRLTGVTKLYKNGDGVRGIDLEVGEGELVTLLGPSGCGKTTILRVVGGFLDADEGRVVLGGQDITRLPPERRPTSMVFQSYNLWPHMTVFENLAFGLKLRKIPRETIAEDVRRFLSLVRIEGSEGKYPTQLSGGQQQRVAIARALILKPQMLLMDEPFSALDAKIRVQMREELKKIQQDLGITVLFVTHDQEEAMSISDRVVVMSKGRFEQIDTPARVYDEPATRFVAEFMGNMNFIDLGDGELVAVRPENLALRPAGSGQKQGRISTVMVLGHFLEINVEAEGGPLKAFMPRESGAQYRVGDAVGLEIGRHRRFPREQAPAAGA
ncbi:MAG TPA: ABC transporter ATP-binding protein [Spirochaetia bacterium]|nr:ABC transporter ATP-binding protein [Spirochaetia bacterium]HRZ63359.1 ABC transporter ATP-binding protein [Spirochaetia bacterium]